MRDVSADIGLWAEEVVVKYRDHEKEVRRLLAEHAATLELQRTKHANREAELLRDIDVLRNRVAWLEAKLRVAIAAGFTLEAVAAILSEKAKVA